MTDRPGVSTTVPNDARSMVLYSITKQATKAKDGLDHRTLSEMARHLIHFDLLEVRQALDELLDEGLLQKETSSRGEGWSPSRASENLGKNRGQSLTAAERRRVASHQGCGTPGVSESAHQSGQGQGLVAHQSYLSTQKLYGTLLRTTPGGDTAPARVVSGSYITRKPSSRLTDPDSPYGLAMYFRRSGQEEGFVWGDTNLQALAYWFKTAKEAGMSPVEVRKLIDTFWVDPVRLRGAGKPPWRVFLNEREALAKRAGVKSHMQTPQVPDNEDPEATKARFFGYWLDTPQPMTEEEMAADRARILGPWANLSR